MIFVLNEEKILATRKKNAALHPNVKWLIPKISCLFEVNITGMIYVLTSKDFLLCSKINIQYGHHGIHMF